LARLVSEQAVHQLFHISYARRILQLGRFIIREPTFISLALTIRGE